MLRHQIAVDKTEESDYVKALDDDSERVQYWAAVGLQRLAGTWPPEGIPEEQFQTNREHIISQLKQKFPTESP